MHCEQTTSATERRLDIMHTLRTTNVSFNAIMLATAMPNSAPMERNGEDRTKTELHTPICVPKTHPFTH
jgi:hypothetical protein